MKSQFLAAAAGLISANPMYIAIRNDVLMPIIYLAFAIALLIFIWGMIGYLVNLRNGATDDKQQAGKRHMIWGAIGVAIMISVFGIMQFIWGTLMSLPAATQGFNGQSATPPPEINGL